MKAGQHVAKTSEALWVRMPLWAKGLVLAGVGFGIYKGVKYAMKMAGDKERKSSKEEAQGWKNELDKQIKTTPPTLSKTQLSSMANAIEKAFDGYGTSDDLVVDQFKMLKNNSDFLGLQVAWGRRTIESGTWNPAPNLTNATLQMAVSDELDSGERKEINNHFAKVGITYRV